MDTYQYMMQNGRTFWGTGSCPGGHNTALTHHDAFPRESDYFTSSEAKEKERRRLERKANAILRKARYWKLAKAAKEANG